MEQALQRNEGALELLSPTTLHFYPRDLEPKIPLGLCGLVFAAQCKSEPKH